MVQSMNLRCAVVIFAHNEAANIGHAITSVLESKNSTVDVSVTVMTNGCMDDTARIVNRLAKNDTRVRMVELGLADKCNAWNVYVHQVSSDVDIHFFMDGDVRCSPDAIPLMANRLADDTDANAIAGLPMSGRNQKKYREYVSSRGWLFGNLYAVRRAHFDRIRRGNIRLPIGCRGNDHLITRIMHSDLQAPWAELPQRVIYHPAAGYEFSPLMPHRMIDVQIYYRRLVTYRWRRLQLRRIWSLPLPELPRNMRGVDEEILEELTMRKWKSPDPISRSLVRRLAKHVRNPQAYREDNGGN